MGPTAFFAWLKSCLFLLSSFSFEFQVSKNSLCRGGTADSPFSYLGSILTSTSWKVMARLPGDRPWKWGFRLFVGQPSLKNRSPSSSSSLLILECFGKLNATFIIIWVIAWHVDFSPRLYLPRQTVLIWKVSLLHLHECVLGSHICLRILIYFGKVRIRLIHSLFVTFTSQNPSMLALIIRITRSVNMVVKNWNNQRCKIG